MFDIHSLYLYIPSILAFGRGLNVESACSSYEKLRKRKKCLGLGYLS